MGDYTNMQSWQSGLMRQPAKLLIALGWSDGSNPSGCVFKSPLQQILFKISELMNYKDY